MSHDPELTDIEGQLFALMRDGVITGLGAVDSSIRARRWACKVTYAEFPFLQQHTFESNISALDAYMQAFNDIATRRLEGKPVYAAAVLKRRKQLGLE